MRDVDALHARSLALPDVAPPVIEQLDVFFPCSSGRLRLRHLAEDQGELIDYARPDRTGPKTSSYQISPTDNPVQLRGVLAAALGESIEVRKTRTLNLVGRNVPTFEP